jgi:TldD protein
MFDILEKCLQPAIRNRTDLVQLRGQERHMTTCTVKNGLVEQFSRITVQGVGARVLVDGRSWGFSSTNVVDSKHVESALKNALGLATAASQLKKQKIVLEPVKDINEKVSAHVEKLPQSISAEEIAKIPLEACSGAQEAGPHIANVEATYISMEDKKYFVSSEGSHIAQDLTRVMLFVNVVARKAGALCPSSENVGHTGGLELFDRTSPHILGRRTAEKAVRLLSVRAAPSGVYQVIIHPTLCATLLHEAIGHPLEADLAMAGGGFGNQMGELVSSELVTIYDDGTVPGGLGQFFYDDEGIPCDRTVLIRNGALESFMHDRTSAFLADVAPTGNAHAWDYSVEPLIRQTNIGIEAGDYTVEEMVEEVKDGLFLEGTFGGQADSNADFTFGFQNARRIENGQFKEEVRGANVAGNAIEVFKTIDAVSNEAVLRPGACGKFQFAVQGRMVPAIRCKIMVGGAGG